LLARQHTDTNAYYTAYSYSYSYPYPYSYSNANTYADASRLL
jgi:hypothetical protein